MVPIRGIYLFRPCEGRRPATALEDDRCTPDSVLFNLSGDWSGRTNRSGRKIYRRGKFLFCRIAKNMVELRVPARRFIAITERCVQKVRLPSLTAPSVNR